MSGGPPVGTEKEKLAAFGKIISRAKVEGGRLIDYDGIRGSRSESYPGRPITVGGSVLQGCDGQKEHCQGYGKVFFLHNASPFQ
jgi:hypothetical protein